MNTIRFKIKLNTSLLYNNYLTNHSANVISTSIYSVATNSAFTIRRNFNKFGIAAVQFYITNYDAITVDGKGTVYIKITLEEDFNFDALQSIVNKDTELHTFLVNNLSHYVNDLNKDIKPMKYSTKDSPEWQSIQYETNISIEQILKDVDIETC